MNAFYLAMCLIFINGGVILVAGLDVFGQEIVNDSLILSFFFSLGESGILGLTVFGGSVIALAAAMSAAATRIAGSNISSTQGIAIVSFAGIFFISFSSALDIFRSILNAIFPVGDYGSIVFGIILTAGILIFVMALVQFASGGVKTHG